mgnify:CR=1 FL=1
MTVAVVVSIAQCGDAGDQIFDHVRLRQRGHIAFERRNPLDHSVATRAPAATPADAVAAVDAAAKARPDGYTLVMASSGAIVIFSSTPQTLQR